MAYRHDQIDPGLQAERSEGEERLKVLRPLLRMAVKSPGLEAFLDEKSASSFPRMISPNMSNMDKWAEAELCCIKSSILDSASKEKPFCARLCSTMRVLTIEEADEQHAEEKLSVPVYREGKVVLPEEQVEGKPFIKLIWYASSFKMIKGASRHAVMFVQRTSKQSVSFTIESAEGTTYHSMHASNLPEVVVDRVFAPGKPGAARQSSEELQRLMNRARAPRAASRLPDALVVQLMDFMQRRLRAHVLVAASGPEDSMRLLRVEEGSLRFLAMREAGNEQPTMRVTARLHEAACTCFCRAHLLVPPEKRLKLSFTGRKSATITLEMCGETLSEDGCCPTHGGNCSKSDFVPKVCCCNLRIKMHCDHEYRKKEGEFCKPVGSSFPIDLQNQFERAELSMLMATASEWHRRAKRVFSNKETTSEQKLEKSARLVSILEADMDARAEKVDRMWLNNPKRVSDQDMQVMDLHAIEKMRQGGLVQAKPVKKGVMPSKLVHAAEGRDANKEEKKLQGRHFWMFPKPGAPYGVRGGGGAGADSAPPDSVAPAAAAAAADPEPRAESPPAKRQCLESVESRDHEYQELTEYLDVEGMRTMRAQINDLLKTSLPRKQRERGQMFLQFLDTLERESGEEVEGPLGYRVKPMVCKYKARNDGGRLYATGGATIQKFEGGYAKTCSIQGVTREIRPFLCCRWSHDYDMSNAQPEMLRQLSGLLTWTDGRSRPSVPIMEEWCARRKEFIEEVAELHNLPRDEDMYPDYRKDQVKRCVISLMFGGQYETFVKSLCESLSRNPDHEPRSEKLQRMEEELAELRRATFQSREHYEFYEKDSKRMIKEGKKVDKDGKPNHAKIDRGVFARIAQRLENDVLTVMRKFFAEEGFEVLSLCFDGCMVKHRRDKSADLAKLNKRILDETGFKLVVLEKEMFSDTFPETSLARV
jgi:hypothetical protein